jgi:hypothetical protein
MLLGGAYQLLPQEAVTIEGQTALKFHGELIGTRQAAVTFVRSVVHQDEQGVEFPVAYWKQIVTGRGGWCGGNLFVSRQRIAFKPFPRKVATVCANTYFDSVRSEVSVSFTKGTAHLVLPSTMYEFKMSCRLELEEIDRVCNDPEPYLFAHLLETSLLDLDKAIKQIQMPSKFHPRDLHLLKAAESTAKAVPIIRLFSPYLSKDERLVMATDHTMPVRGIAIYPDGITSVTVNGQPATVTSLADNVVEFEATSVVLEPKLNAIAISAIAPDKSESRMTLLVLQPVPAQGNLNKTRLSEENIERALRGGVGEAELTSLVRKYGVDFALSDEIETKLRSLGATAELLLAITKMKLGP